MTPKPFSANMTGMKEEDALVESRLVMAELTAAEDHAWRQFAQFESLVKTRIPGEDPQIRKKNLLSAYNSMNYALDLHHNAFWKVMNSIEALVTDKMDYDHSHTVLTSECTSTQDLIESKRKDLDEALKVKSFNTECESLKDSVMRFEPSQVTLKQVETIGNEIKGMEEKLKTIESMNKETRQMVKVMGQSLESYEAFCASHLALTGVNIKDERIYDAVSKMNEAVDKLI